MELLKGCILILSALFPIVNPLGGAPVFLSLTQGCTGADRKLLSGRVAINSFLLLVGSFIVGSHILSFFGVSLPIVQVGGGLIVISTGWALLKQKDDEIRQEVDQTADRQQILLKAFYPLTLPLTVGPGSISVAITLGANAPHMGAGRLLLGLLAAVIASAIVAVAVFLSYAYADHAARLLGPSAVSVVGRLSAFLLVCIGLQILWNGASVLLKGL